jgi:hypothetical protein
MTGGDPVRVGISGTQRGATEAQKRTLRAILGSPDVTGLVHGGCHGVDEEADELYRQAHGLPGRTVYPAIGGRGRYPDPDHLHAPRPPLERNRLIVRDAELMVIVPRQGREIRRSGTWATCRYARAAGVPTVIIYPDGTALPAP